MTEKSPHTESPHDWSDMLALTDEQIHDIYQQYPGVTNSMPNILINAVKQVRNERVQAQTDEVTGIGNRKAMNEWETNYYRPEEMSYVAVVFDLRNFKPVHDRLGHAMGDLALRIFAEKLVRLFRFSYESRHDNRRAKDFSSPDLLAIRMGGDEFAVVLPIESDLKAEQVSIIVLERIKSVLAVTAEDLHLEEGDLEHDITPRFAFAASAPDYPYSLQDLLDEADGIMTRNRDDESVR